MRIFSLFIHTDTSSTPVLLIEAATDETSARALAKAALAESPHRILVEVREEDRLLFSIDRCDAMWSAHESRPA
jgi:hypothetical protein